MNTFNKYLVYVCMAFALSISVAQLANMPVTVKAVQLSQKSLTYSTGPPYSIPVFLKDTESVTLIASSESYFYTGTFQKPNGKLLL